MKNRFLVFVVEDDAFYGAFLRHHLALDPEIDVEVFRSGSALLSEHRRTPSVITLDYSLPGEDGETLQKRISRLWPQVPVVIVSGQEDVSTAVRLLHSGAYDYITKDENTPGRLRNTLGKIRETQALRSEVEQLRRQIRQKQEPVSPLIGQSPALQKVFHLLEKAARSTITVSIYGETGTGKEVVARTIHAASDRRAHPFVALNVAALPPDLIEAELFGYEKGAFTGAVARRIGKLEEASGGTLFMDEIAEMSPAVQAKLLRVLQEQELSRLGSNQLIKTDFRLLVATHKNLAEEMQQGRFREDLYYRLLGLTLELPPLRERGDDIALLARHFADEYSRRNGLGPFRLSEEALTKLGGYAFPGNVRELKAITELACVMASGGQITAADITFPHLRPAALPTAEMTLRDYTRHIIRQYLERYDNNVLLVARKLDIGKSTIYNLLKSGELMGPS
ncbi:sigma-54-dependent transcriptional regulator [Tellurirhabdus rosea]|uniref:sigma-54-dependent transcriptional regulator n=1 Tax=Tellurirhabdus rosea TaxID=2674997 RepID=UPI00225503DA|nr:sigma-54 dependent transcriptional regulator [Tellurirhabdus rosea]